jgi:hypothetical protein
MLASRLRSCEKATDRRGVAGSPDGASRRQYLADGGRKTGRAPLIQRGLERRCPSERFVPGGKRYLALGCWSAGASVFGFARIFHADRAFARFYLVAATACLSLGELGAHE